MFILSSVKVHVTWYSLMSTFSTFSMHFDTLDYLMTLFDALQYLSLFANKNKKCMSTKKSVQKQKKQCTKAYLQIRIKKCVWAHKKVYASYKKSNKSNNSIISLAITSNKKNTWCPRRKRLEPPFNYPFFQSTPVLGSLVSIINISKN